MERRSTASLILDFILVLVTGGLWLLWIIIKYLRTRDVVVYNVVPEQRGTFSLLIDFILVLMTGGLWLLWIFIKFLRRS